MAQVAVLGLLFAIAMTQPAYAYIDPGTASIALQAVIGAIAVTGLYFRSTVAKALRLLRPGKQASESAARHRAPGSVETKVDDS